jgi:hypothetical protein
MTHSPTVYSPVHEPGRPRPRREMLNDSFLAHHPLLRSPGHGGEDALIHCNTANSNALHGQCQSQLVVNVDDILNMILQWRN